MSLKVWTLDKRISERAFSDTCPRLRPYMGADWGSTPTYGHRDKVPKGSSSPRAILSKVQLKYCTLENTLSVLVMGLLGAVS